jgi:hypothetical protein
MTDETKLTAYDLCAAIKERYPLPEWHCEAEVTIERRRLDVVALNMWTTRRHGIVGFEIKVSRGDWLREIANFQKAEGWLAVCDTFYVVTPPKLIKSDELPDGWGHLELCGSRMMTRRNATPREPSATLPRELAARFLNRMATEVEHTKRNVRYQVREEVRKEIEASVRQKLEERFAGELKTATDDARQFHQLIEALGLKYEWKPADRAVRLAKLLGKLNADRNLIGAIEDMLRKIEAPLQSLKDVAAVLSDKEPAEAAA